MRKVVLKSGPVARKFSTPRLLGGRGLLLITVTVVFYSIFASLCLALCFVRRVTKCLFVGIGSVYIYMCVCLEEREISYSLLPVVLSN